MPMCTPHSADADQQRAASRRRWRARGRPRSGRRARRRAAWRGSCGRRACPTDRPSRRRPRSSPPSPAARGRRDPGLLRAQHEKGLAEARQREHRADRRPPTSRPGPGAPGRALIGLTRLRPRCRAGSRTPSSSNATASSPGITATQNTARKSSAHNSMRPTASSGPRKRPPYRATGADQRRRRGLGGVMSAIRASRGAPRTPLPTRSTRRAVEHQPTPDATANSGLVNAPKA